MKKILGIFVVLFIFSGCTSINHKKKKIIINRFTARFKEIDITVSLFHREYYSILIAQYVYFTISNKTKEPLKLSKSDIFGYFYKGKTMYLKKRNYPEYINPGPKSIICGKVAFLPKTVKEIKYFFVKMGEKEYKIYTRN